jgi:hypothetical protein
LRTVVKVSPSYTVTRPPSCPFRYQGVCSMTRAHQTKAESARRPQRARSPEPLVTSQPHTMHPWVLQNSTHAIRDQLITLGEVMVRLRAYSQFMVPSTWEERKSRYEVQNVDGEGRGGESAGGKLRYRERVQV